MRSPRLRCLALSVAAAGLAPAASLEERIETLFRPPLAETAALSADGERVAYTAPAGGKLTVVMQLLEPLGPRRTVPVDPERPVAASPSPGAIAPALPPSPAHLRFLRWAGPNRLVFAPAEHVVPLPPVSDAAGRLRPNPDGPAIHAPIYAIDADGRHRGTLVDSSHFKDTPEEARQSLADLLKTPDQMLAARPPTQRDVGWRMPHLDILGFHPREPDQLIVATRGAHSLPAQHLVDTRTASLREFGGWPAPPGPPHVFDWFRLKPVGERRDTSPPSTLWHDAELARLQRETEARFPRRHVELLDWSDHRNRVLVRVTGGSDPGRLFVLQRPEEIVLEVTRLAPWLKPAHVHETRPFAFTAADGTALGGHLTWPAKPRAATPPLLVIFPSDSVLPRSAWDPEAQVFADFGFAVARLHPRSAASAHAAAPEQLAVADAHAALAALAQSRPAAPAVDLRRVAVLGRGFGGHLAVRAVQWRPDAFHAAVAIDAPLGPADETAPPHPAAPHAASPGHHRHPAASRPAESRPPAAPVASVLAEAEKLTQPLLLLGDARRHPARDASAAALRTRLESLGRKVAHVPLEPDFAAARPAALAATYRRIDEFLAAHLPPPAPKTGVAREAP